MKTRRTKADAAIAARRIVEEEEYQRSLKEEIRKQRNMYNKANNRRLLPGQMLIGGNLYDFGRPSGFSEARSKKQYVDGRTLFM